MAKNIQRGGIFHDLKPAKPTVTPTQEYTPTPVARERKTKRLQLVLRESTVDRLGSYAKDHDTSRNEIVQTLIDEFLGKEGY